MIVSYTGEPMHYTEFERRKYPRFNAEIPVDIGLIDLQSRKSAQAQFKGITKDISMEGLGLELNYPASEILSFAPRLVGANKEFDFDLDVNLGAKHVRGVGEVRWARIHSPSVLRMGLSLKEMRDGEKKKWTNFVMSQTECPSRHVSRLHAYSKHTLIISLPRLMRDLITSPYSRNYGLPAVFITSSIILYWLVQLKFSHVLIPCGITATVIFLAKSGIFSRHPKPRSKIPQWFPHKFFRRLRGDVSKNSRE